jgi:O-antigen/teichoic acid export membrane protein
VRALWSGAAFRAVNMAAQLLSLSLTVRYLGKERYGVWTTVSTVAAWLTLANFGLGQGLTTRLASLHGDDRREQRYRAICSSAAVVTLVSLVLLPLLIVACQLAPWPRIFNVRSELAIAETRPTILVCGLAVLAMLPLSVASGVLTGHQRGDVVNLTGIVSSVVGLIAVVVAVRLRWGMPGLCAVLLVPQVGALVAQVVAARWMGLVRFAPRYVSAGEARDMLGLGSLFLLTQLFGIFIFETGALIIANRFGAEEVTPYGITNRVVMAVVTVFGLIITPLWPAYGDAFARGDTEWARRAFIKSLRAVTLIWLVAAVGLGVAGKWVIRLWAGPDAVPTTPLLWAMVLYALALGWGMVVTYPLNGSGKLRPQVAAAVICGLLNVPLALFLAGRIGIPGVVLSQALVMLLIAVPVQGLAVLRMLAPAAPAPR